MVWPRIRPRIRPGERQRSEVMKLIFETALLFYKRPEATTTWVDRRKNVALLVNDTSSPLFEKGT